MSEDTVVHRKPSVIRVSAALAAVALAAACGDGSTGPAPQVTVPNRAPAAVGTIPGLTLTAGDTESVDVSSYFSDPDGDALSYVAGTSGAEVATASVSGSTVTVTGVAPGTATVTVTARDPGGLSVQQSFTVTVPNRAPEVTETISPQTIGLDEALEVQAHLLFSDPDGDSLTYDASSSDPGVAAAEAVVDGEFQVVSVSAGTTTITVTATDPGGLSAQVMFELTVTGSPLAITGVEPEVFIEGASATIMGTGFSLMAAANQVSIGGLAALVTGVTETSLTVEVPEADCLPPRRNELRVTVAGQSEGLEVGVTPVIPEEDVQVTDAGNGCVHLPGSMAGGEYLIGVVSISEDVSSLTPVTLNGLPGDATVVGAARYAAAPGVPEAMLRTAELIQSRPVQSPMASRGEARLPSLVAGESLRIQRARAHNETRARDVAMRRALGPVIPPSLTGSAAVARQSVAVADTLPFYINQRTCTEADSITAVVRLVSDDLVWLDDLGNPSGTFSDSELRGLDAFYSKYVKGVHTDYFGDLSDVDGNGRVFILMSKEINRQGGVLGKVLGIDLSSQDQCATSNEAEIFYGLVPDPDGSLGDAWTVEKVFDEYLELLAHEIVHLVQNNYEIFGEAGRDFVFWEAEGSATLAEQLVGYRFFGHGSGQDLGWEEWLESEQELIYETWFFDMVGFFGRDGETKIAGAPEQCSWVGKSDAGNTGPCVFRPVYGVPAMVLRYAMDRWGDEYPGGEQALMRRFIQSPPPHEGFASLVDVSPSSSWSIEQILADFYITLGLEVLKDVVTDGMASWDLYDIFDGLSPNWLLQPYTSSSASPEIEASIRAGSSLYFDWTPDGSRSPTSIKVTLPGGIPVPGHISV